MKSSNLITVIKKELKRVFDDRRLVFTAMILPAISIAIIYSLMGTMLGNMMADREEHIPSVYVQNAPADFQLFISQSPWQEQMNLVVLEDNANAEAIKNDILVGNADLLIVFEDDFSYKLTNYQSYTEVPIVNTFYNSSEEYSSDARFRLFSNIFSQYEHSLIGERLGNNEYANAFDIDRNNSEGNIVDERKATGKGLGMLLPMLITIFLFAGGMGIGMDIIAGEKERGTMATLLVTPVKRETIAFGKIIGLAIVSIISAASSFIGILVSLPFSGAMFGNGASEVNLEALKFGIPEYAQLVLLMLTMVGVFVGIISLASIIAKNVKEAGTYVTPMYMLVMISGFLNMFTTSSASLWQYTIPVYGSVVALKSLFSFELTWTHIAICCSSNILITGVFIWMIKKMFNSEKIMFGA